MKKILVLYFSGAGATKKVAELIYAQLSQSQSSEVYIFSIESEDMPNIVGYDALVIGTPTYHAAPPKALMDYIDTISRLPKESPVFIYNTRGLCSLNTNRILAKQLQNKNIVTIMDRAYRSPASDGSLFAPFIGRFFEFEKDLEKKINCDCMAFLELLKQDIIHGYIPRFQFGSIINAPNKAAGQLITKQIYLHKDKCIKCGMCIEQCPHKTFSTDKQGYPLFNPKNCENCYRCVHYCPEMALSLSKRKTPKKLLKYKEYTFLKQCTTRLLLVSLPLFFVVVPRLASARLRPPPRKSTNFRSRRSEIFEFSDLLQNEA